MSDKKYTIVLVLGIILGFTLCMLPIMLHLPCDTKAFASLQLGNVLELLGIMMFLLSTFGFIIRTIYQRER